MVLEDVNTSSTIIFTDESTKAFSTFPCSADKGTVVPPETRSSTISVISTLVAMSVVLLLIFIVLDAMLEVFVVIEPVLAFILFSFIFT